MQNSILARRRQQVSQVNSNNMGVAFGDKRPGFINENNTAMVINPASLFSFVEPYKTLPSLCNVTHYSLFHMNHCLIKK